jgi:hypothetical protein
VVTFQHTPLRVSPTSNPHPHSPLPKFDKTIASPVQLAPFGGVGDVCEVGPDGVGPTDGVGTKGERTSAQLSSRHAATVRAESRRMSRTDESWASECW